MTIHFNNNSAIIPTLLFLMSLIACKDMTTNTSSDPLTSYEMVENDPTKTRIYTLKNGLKVYISPFNKEPRIYTRIAVKAGSKYDPKETTGLAHYLEHMLFKGTQKIGTIDWEKEKVLLEQISRAYEEHRLEKDPSKKASIYNRIDSLSLEAAKYAVANEYDKMVSSLGAKGTNAYTSNEETVYINDIPSNELEKWAKLESERMHDLVLRLFHTELETVYEEFNRSQDNDFRKSYEELMKHLFPTHPYGSQTTIGEGEHLKNPSMVNIHNYFNTYYVPNNMAICIAGDINPDSAIKVINNHFGKWERKDVPDFNYPSQPVLESPILKSVYGSQAEHILMGYRFDGAHSKDADYIKIINKLLYNGSAGLLDLHLTQAQKVLMIQAFEDVRQDYSIHMFYAKPRTGQSLDEVRGLILGEIEKIKSGEFEDWMLEAVIKNLKLEREQSLESNYMRTAIMTDAFIQEKEWKSIVEEIAQLEQITKEDIMKFAAQHYKENYVSVNKLTGEDTTLHKVEKPIISSIPINRDSSSLFYQDFQRIESPRIQPVFMDFDKDMKASELDRNTPFYYISNPVNKTFTLYYYLEMGSDHIRELPLATEYLNLIGTDKHSPSQLRQEFYKLGLNFGVSSGENETYVYLSGLDESFAQGVELFEYFLENAKADQAILDDLVKTQLKKREDAKKDKGAIMSALVNYGKYGASSPFTNALSTTELQSLKADDLVALIHQITSYPHIVVYYGTQSEAEVKTQVNTVHIPSSSSVLTVPARKVFPELAQDMNKVFFVDYEMVQVEIRMLSKLFPFDQYSLSYTQLFNEYFGSGLSSIVFQEIRESKALAYAANSFISTPERKDQSHYLGVYIGTQNDKLQDAVEALHMLLNNMPEAENQFTSAIDAARKVIETERKTGREIFLSYVAAKRRGLSDDVRKTTYNKLGTISLPLMKKFFDEQIKGKQFTYLVVGKKSLLDMKALQEMGVVTELKVNDLWPK